MKAASDRKSPFRIWSLGATAVLFSIASAFSYLGYIAQGIVVGDLLGLSGREADVAVAQQRATYWLITSMFCLTGSTLTAAFALPLYADTSRLPRFIARFVLASILSLVLTLFIGVVVLSIVTALHKSVVQ
jgi:hypothetical protein